MAEYMFNIGKGSWGSYNLYDLLKGCQGLQAYSTQREEVQPGFYWMGFQEYERAESGVLPVVPKSVLALTSIKVEVFF